ncbi:MAG TPA: hypothetical protein VHW02_01600 [Rhizomicrobium sp.]|jgi:hypothetical protein|nr:hypothetical protein [Rhizomicrobium sp.]
MGVGNNSGSRRTVFIALGVVAVLSLLGCGALGLLPYQGDASALNFKNYDQVARAFGKIVPGETRLSELSALGFDAQRSAHVEALSYLGVIERFLPHDSAKFDELNPAVQNCIEARDHCSAIVFDREAKANRDTSNSLLQLLGFESASAAQTKAADVFLLIQDGRVTYKMMRGEFGRVAARN